MDVNGILDAIDSVILGYSLEPTSIESYWYRQFLRNLKHILEKYSTDNANLISVDITDNDTANKLALWQLMATVRTRVKSTRPVISIQQFSNPPPPSVWGPRIWALLHYITFLFPNVPDKNDQNLFQIFFQSIAYVLPCPTCRKHLSEWYEKFPIRLENKTALAEWLIQIHNQVNSSIGKRSNWTLREVLFLRGRFLSAMVSKQQQQQQQQQQTRQAARQSAATARVPARPVARPNFQFKSATRKPQAASQARRSAAKPQPAKCSIARQNTVGPAGTKQLVKKRYSLSCNCGRVR
jgi:hypothetical protein